MSDPTYNHELINADPVWKLAWEMSEVDNDMAPIGWGKYRTLAKWLIDTYEIRERLSRNPISEQKND